MSKDRHVGGFKFVFNGAHTINVWKGALNVDCMTVGDMAQDKATAQDVKRGIDNWLKYHREDHK